MFIVVVFPDLRFRDVDHEEVAAGCVGRPFCNQRRGEVNGCVVDGERECIEEGVRLGTSETIVVVVAALAMLACENRRARAWVGAQCFHIDQNAR